MLKTLNIIYTISTIVTMMPYILTLCTVAKQYKSTKNNNTVQSCINLNKSRFVVGGMGKKQLLELYYSSCLTLLYTLLYKKKMNGWEIGNDWV